MIEKREAVENLSEILEIPDLGFVFLGPGDLAVQLGYPGEPNLPDVAETSASIREAALDARIPVGRIANDPSRAQEAIDDGYQIVRIGGELEAAQQTIGDRLAQLRN